MDNNPSVNGELQDSKSLADSIEGDFDKSNLESDENKCKSIIATESVESAENTSTRVSPNNDHSIVRKHSSMGDSMFEGGQASAAMNHSAGSLVSVGIATKSQKWCVVRLFRYLCICMKTLEYFIYVLCILCIMYFVCILKHGPNNDNSMRKIFIN